VATRVATPKAMTIENRGVSPEDEVMPAARVRVKCGGARQGAREGKYEQDASPCVADDDALRARPRFRQRAYEPDFETARRARQIVTAEQRCAVYVIRGARAALQQFLPGALR